MGIRLVVVALCWGATLIVSSAAPTAAPVPQESALPPGEGRDLVIQLCTDCHGINLSVTTRRTLPAWEDAMVAMRGRGVGGTDEELDRATLYLARAFGKVDVNSADARSLEIVLELTPPIVDALIKARPFAQLADLAKVAGLDMRAMEARKDRMSFAPAAPMQARYAVR